MGESPKAPGEVGKSEVKELAPKLQKAVTETFEAVKGKLPKVKGLGTPIIAGIAGAIAVYAGLKIFFGGSNSEG